MKIVTAGAPSLSVEYKQNDFKYWLTADTWWQSRIRHGNEEIDGTPATIEYRDKHDVVLVSLSPDGLLFAREGCGTDGPSGPTIDRPVFMRGSFGHDFEYMLMRHGLLDRKWREAADDDLLGWIIEDGMSPWWAKNIVHRGVRWFAGKYVKASQRKPILRAP